MIVGLDPGIEGAIAIIDHARVIHLDDLPTHRAQHGQRAKIRHELDLHTLCVILKPYTIMHCYIERVAAMPRQVLSSTFRFAESFGQLQGVIVAMGMTLIAPRDWQRHHKVGAERDGYRQRAVQLYPSVADRPARRRDHNRAAALLLALYGQVMQQRHLAA